MSMGQDDSQAHKVSNADALKFVHTSAPVLGKTTVAADEDEEGFGDADLADLESQCPKLAKLIRDLGEESDEPPQSFYDFLSCFDITLSEISEDPEETGEKIAEAFNDLGSLLGCICGSGSPAALNWQAYAAANSSVSGSGFNASSSNAGGTSFNASGSNAGVTAFNASGSNAGGAAFSAD
jgi:hypothetical protein